MFTEEEEKILNSVSILKTADAAFIRHLLQFLYKEDLKLLQKRSFSGKTRTPKAKNVNEPQQIVSQEPFKPISPMKKKVIFGKFTERIKNSKISTQEQFQRLETRYVAQLVAWGIANLRKIDEKALE